MNTNKWLAYFEAHFAPQVKRHKGYKTLQYKIAGKIVRIHFSSIELSSMLSLAIIHQLTDMQIDCDLEIYVWKRGDIMPLLPYNPEEKYLQSSSKWLFHGDSSVINVFSTQENRGYCIIDSDSPPKSWTIASPLRKILDWYLSKCKIYIIHGAVIGHKNSAVLITGASGVGKSTIAMHCAAQKMIYLSDDHVAIDESATAYGLYCSLKVLKDSPFVINNFANEFQTKGEKRVFFLNNTFNDQLLSSIKIKAVLFPIQDRQKEPSLDSAVLPEQTTGVSPFALKQSVWIEKHTSSDLISIISKLPHYNLYCGSNPADIPQMIMNFCDGL